MLNENPVDLVNTLQVEVGLTCVHTHTAISCFTRRDEIDRSRRRTKTNLFKAAQAQMLEEIVQLACQARVHFIDKACAHFLSISQFYLTIRGH